MKIFYKGYIQTKNKTSLEPIKNRDDFKSYDEVKNLDEFAGILSDEIILVDIDNQEQADILHDLIVIDKKAKCRILETNRGMHFLFRNSSENFKSRNGVKNAIGLTCDFKSGKRNGYQMLKIDGEERPIIYDPEEIDVLPKWLEPIKSKYEFWNLEEGDGRNQSLFEYILILQSSGFSKEEARETIQIINDHVLIEPLPADEIETILRDEAFSKESFFDKNIFLFDKFSNFLKSQYHIKKINGRLHFYDDGIYSGDALKIEAKMINHIPNLNKNRRSEVMSYLNLLCSEDSNSDDSNLIAFRNGVYDLESDELLPFSPDFIIANKINWDFNSEAYYKLTDDTLNKITYGNKKIRNLIEEMIGYTMFRRSTLESAFILTGEKSNGKSTLLDMITTMLGNENITALDLGELSERFKTAELAGKLANIGDDINGEYISDTGVFKKLVTGNIINAERKGQDPFNFSSYATLIFSANSIPRLGRGKDNSAIAKRLTTIPFKATFSKDDPDYRPSIKYDLRDQESMEYLIQIGLKGLRRALKQKNFTKTKEAEEELREYEISNNPVLAFTEEKDRSEYLNEESYLAYSDYKDFCSMNGLHPLSSREFGKQIRTIWSFDSKVSKINGKSVRVYVEEE